MPILNEPSGGASNELRLFVQSDNPVEGNSVAEIDRQLPFLQPLCRQFERVTGWQIGFAETGASFLRRNDPADPSDTVFGHLRVEDMSSSGAAALRPSPRKETDQLVQTLDRMIRVIQDDRSALAHATTELAPSVDLPFERWRLEGMCGIAGGGLATWAIDPGEQVYFLSASVGGDCPLRSARVLAEIRAAFDVAMRLGACTERIQREILAIGESRGVGPSLQAALISFDPIIGTVSPHWIGKNRGCGMYDSQADHWTRIEDEFLTSQQLCLLSPVSWEPADRTPNVLRCGHDELLSSIASEWVGHPWLAITRR